MSAPVTDLPPYEPPNDDENETWWSGMGAEPPDPSRRDETPLPQATCALTAPEPAPIEWGIDGLWTKGDYGLLVGDDGSFKSACALHIAAAVAGGYPVFGHFAAERAPVLVVSAEDPANVVQLRLEAFVRGHEWDRRRVLENVHYIATPDVVLTEPRWKIHLAAECGRIEPKLIVLDPLAEILGGDENSNTEARPFLKWLRSLSRCHDAMLMVVHHFGKNGPDKTLRDKIRGASSFLRASRVTYAFEWLEGGVAVQCLKLSRAPKLATFVVKREVEHEEGNRAMWTWARLTYQDAKDAAAERGENFIVVQLKLASERLTTRALRDLAQGTGVRAEDIQTGLTRLQAKGLITCTKGPKNSKLWGLADAPPAADDDPLDLLAEA